MITVGDVETNSIICQYPNIRGCAKYENIEFEKFKKELEENGYYADNDTVYTRTRKNKPIVVLIDDERKGMGVRYDSINQCLLHTGLNYADILRGVTPDGKIITVLRK